MNDTNSNEIAPNIIHTDFASTIPILLAVKSRSILLYFISPPKGGGIYIPPGYRLLSLYQNPYSVKDGLLTAKDGLRLPGGVEVCKR